MKNTSVSDHFLLRAFEKQFDASSFDDELIKLRGSSSSYLALSFSITPIDLLAVIEQVKDENNFHFYWEKPNDQFSIAAFGELERIINSGDSRFRSSSRQGKELLGKVFHLKGINHQNAVVHLLGGFSFYDQNNSSEWKNYGSASFTLPEWMIIKEGKCCIITFCVSVMKTDSVQNLKEKVYQKIENLERVCNVEEYIVQSNKRVGYEKPSKKTLNNTFEEWAAAIEEAKQKIAENEFEKVVLARELILKTDQKVSDTFIVNQLRKQYPDCYSFLIRHNDSSSFIGCTPERLASFNAQFVLTEGLAGSTSRGKTASEDVKLEQNLLHSNKDLKEHEIVLDAIEENLSEYSDRVEHPNHPTVKKLSNVQHLYTPIRATIKNGVSRTEVLKNLHPTPAVGGYPRSEAVEFIKQHEKFDRGWYAGPVGWINANGNGEFAVAIRSGLIKNDEVRFYAGCGIVQDSDPEKEWEETNLKFIPMLTALEYAGT